VTHLLLDICINFSLSLTLTVSISLSSHVPCFVFAALTTQGKQVDSIFA